MAPARAPAGITVLRVAHSFVSSSNRVSGWVSRLRDGNARWCRLPRVRQPPNDQPSQNDLNENHRRQQRRMGGDPRSAAVLRQHERPIHEVEDDDRDKKCRSPAKDPPAENTVRCFDDQLGEGPMAEVQPDNRCCRPGHERDIGFMGNDVENDCGYCLQLRSTEIAFTSTRRGCRVPWWRQ